MSRCIAVLAAMLALSACGGNSKPNRHSFGRQIGGVITTIDNDVVMVLKR
jgi:hypothetical protein